MNPSRLFIERPIATALLMAAIVLAGLAAYASLPVAALPQADYPTIQVQTFYPGASPDVMATSVTAPLERQFGQLAGMTQMMSTSSDGSSIIVLQFALDLNIDVAEQEVQAAINAAQGYLPTDLPVPPVYSKSNPADAPVLTLAITSDILPLPQVEDLVDTRLAPKVSQLSGVGLVSISGGQKPAIRVQANPVALASYGLSFEDLRNALAATNVNAPKGSFDGAAQNYQINANDQILSSTGYRDVVIAYKNGNPVMLSSVAKVVDGVENTKLAAWKDKTPAIILNVRRQPGANTIAVVDEIKKLLPNLTSTLPASVHVQVLTDRTVTIHASVKDVEFELMLTIILVVIVIFVFLGSFRATLIPSVAVPVSLIGTLGVMSLLGYSINNLTMMAFTISTGFVVDDAIVMLENITRYLEEGLSPMEAALKGAGEIGFTIVSLTVSLIAVLIPLLFMGDIVGRLFREFAVTLSVTILISAVVSLSLTPMMSSRLLRSVSISDRSWFHRKTEQLFDKTVEFYGRTLRWVLRHQAPTLLVALGLLVLTVLQYIEIPKGFFPTQDTGILQGITLAPESTSFSEMSRLQQTVAAEILKDPAVESLSSFIGVDGTSTTLNSGRIQINLKPVESRKLTASDAADRIGERVKKVSGIQLFLQPVQDLTVDDRVTSMQYQYTLEDPDSKELKEWTAKLVDRLKQLPELTSVVTDEQDDGRSAHIEIDRATASRLNITPDELDSSLYDAFGQRQIGTYYTQANQYHVILEALPQFQRSPSNLNNLFLQDQSGSPSPTQPVSGRSSAQSSASVFTLKPTSAGALAQPASSTSLSGNASPALSSQSTGSAMSSSSATQSQLSMSPTTRTSSSATSSTNQTASSSSLSTSSQSGNSQPLPVPLSAVSHYRIENSPLTISRQGQFPVVTISFNVAKGKSLGQAVDAIRRAQDQLDMPSSVLSSFQGTAESYSTIGSNEVLLILAALIAVYLVLGILYESFIHPVTILSTLPSAGVGALLALRIFHQDLDIIAIIGIILLIGIVKKNGIMIVDFALEAERTEQMSPEEAIFKASKLRLRPILMTTMCALLAGIPLALGGGIGSELRRPLGIAMVGGLLVSQILTLYTTPVIYVFFDRLAGKRRAVEGHEKASGATA